MASVGATAGKEYQIEQGLDKMNKEWKGIELQIVPYDKAPGCHILKGVDELLAVLDEQLTRYDRNGWKRRSSGREVHCFLCTVF